MQPTPVVPTAVTTLLQMFEAELSEVSFPDVDLDTLRHQVDQCAAHAAAVGELSVQLQQAQQELETQRAALAVLSAKAVAYARVYRSDDPAWCEQLDALKLDSRRSARRAKKQAPRPRRRRAQAPDPSSVEPAKIVGANAEAEVAAAE